MSVRRELETLRADLRGAIRQFARAPMPTLTMVVVLALGIGANTALFTIVHSQVTAPPPGVPRDADIVRIRARLGAHMGMSYRELQEHAGQRDVFADVAGWTWDGGPKALDGDAAGSAPVNGTVTYVTPNYFEVLGVRVLGSSLLNAGDEMTAVISHRLWEDLYGGAPSIGGRTIRVNDKPATIVGVVAEPRFKGTDGYDRGGRVVWMPIPARAVIEGGGNGWLTSYDSTDFKAAARLRRGVLIEKASAAAALAGANAERMLTRRSSRPRTGPAADVVPMRTHNDEESDYAKRRLIVTTAASGALTLLVLLITCTNVSALLAAQAVARRREIAVRLSLGAGRPRIVRQLVTESVLIAFAAGALGVAILFLLLEPAEAFMPDIQLVLAWPTIAFSCVFALGTGVLFGLSPALHGTRVSVSEVLKDSAASVSGSRLALQRSLVVAQVALTQPLLVGVAAVLLLVARDATSELASPFEDRVASLSITSDAPARRSEEWQRTTTLLAQALAEQPGVVAAVPHAGYGLHSPEPQQVHPGDRVAGHEPPETFRIARRPAAPGYLHVMALPLVRGREFEEADSAAAIIGSDLAAQLWGAADPIGRRIQGVNGASTLTVVGVFDARVGGDTETTRGYRVFVPLGAAGPVSSVLLRTAAPVPTVMRQIREAARAHVPGVSITGFTTLAQTRAEQRKETLRAGTIAGGAGFLALLLAAIGLNALISLSVRQRTREIGIRTSLGALPRRVIGLFFLSGLRLAAIGLLCGLPLSLVALRFVQGLEGDQPLPSGLLALIVASAVIAVASLATWIPARRAALVDPLTALRADGA